MTARFRVVHYLNQFFAGFGGEDEAAREPVSMEGPVGPGRVLQDAFQGEAEIVGTVACGDNFYAEHTEAASERLLELIQAFKPDLLVAGPAFDAGRYGFACGHLCRTAGRALHIPALSAMAEENPGLEFRRDVYIVPTSGNVRGMNAALQEIARLGPKLMRGETLRSAREEGYFPRGSRKNALAEKSGADRALDMVLAKISGETFQTELDLPKFDRVPPAPPVKDLSRATLALITTGGLIPKGNPDRLESTKATRYGRYPIGGVDTLDPSAYEGNHGGYSTMYVDEDPNRLLPLDVLRAMEREGRIGKLSDHLYTFSGCSTYYESATRMGEEIAQGLKELGADAAFITSA
jgi:glycine reductase